MLPFPDSNPSIDNEPSELNAYATVSPPIIMLPLLPCDSFLEKMFPVLVSVI